MMRELSLASLVLAATLSACASPSVCGQQNCAEDMNINAQVMNHIDADPALAPDHLRAQTIDKVVYLNGLADTRLEIYEAGRLAKDVSGVKKVVNDIGVSPDGI